MQHLRSAILSSDALAMLCTVCRLFCSGHREGLHATLPTICGALAKWQLRLVTKLLLKCYPSGCPVSHCDAVTNRAPGAAGHQVVMCPLADGAMHRRSSARRSAASTTSTSPSRSAGRICSPSAWAAERRSPAGTWTPSGCWRRRSLARALLGRPGGGAARV